MIQSLLFLRDNNFIHSALSDLKLSTVFSLGNILELKYKFTLHLLTQEKLSW